MKVFYPKRQSVRKPKKSHTTKQKLNRGKIVRSQRLDSALQELK